ncbi:MAG: type I 3-dehydroquinate dehydratase, partial [Planctomycetes bacterium]|nr:type I 3-dehydroquinate dehydratase [Planctomycetota bacterium]
MGYVETLQCKHGTSFKATPILLTPPHIFNNGKDMIDIVVPIFAQNLELLVGQSLDAKSAGATMIELRLDLCAELGANCTEIVAAISSLLLPVMATNRSVDEGGKWPGSEADRLQLLIDADAAGAAYIDVEFAHIQSLSIKFQHAKLILSHHDFNGMGENHSKIINDMYAAGADIAKIAVTASDSGDLAIIESLYQEFSEQEERGIVAIAMGEEGLPSRLLA